MSAPPARHAEARTGHTDAERSRHGALHLALARQAGRFHVRDERVALACIGGALLGVVSLVGVRPREVDRAADELARNLLQMFGLTPAETAALTARPLPRPRGRRRDGVDRAM